MVGRKILLLAKIGESARNYPRAELPRDLAGPVRASRIDHHDLVSDALQRLDRLRQVGLFVIGNENGADGRHACAHEPTARTARAAKNSYCTKPTFGGGTDAGA